MKKLLTVIFSMSFLIIFVFMLTSCDETQSLNFENDRHIHNFNDIYHYDEKTHWKECMCGARSEEILHSFSANDLIQQTSTAKTEGKKRICRICQYEVQEDLPQENHTHSYGGWIIEKEAKENITGLMKRMCMVCDYEQEVIIPALPHEHTYLEEWTYDEKVHYHKASCDHSDEKKDLSRHCYSDWIIVQEALENVAGLRKRSCQECLYEQTEEIPALSHTHTYLEEWMSDETTHYHPATCGHEYEKKDIENHTYSSWIVVNEPTENMAGLKRRACLVCSFTQTETIPVLEHQHTPSTEWIVDKEPTCEKTGVRSQHCLTCNQQMNTIEIPALGHTYEQWEVVVEPTLSSTGLIIRVCTRDINHSDIVNLPILNHKEYSYEIIEEPTCKKVGTACYAYQKDGQILSFSYALDTVDHEPYSYWYFYENVHWQECKNCLEELYKEEHIFDSNLHCTICDYIGCLGTPGLYYILTGDGSSYAVTNYFGDDSIIEIPETYNGLPVSRIGEHIFEKNHHITEVTLPSSIKKIGEAAFNQCFALTKINLPEGLVEVDAYAFASCLKLKEITLPSTLQTIGDYAFSSCASLQEIVIPDSVLFIGASAFASCQKAIKIELPKNVVSIGKEAFHSCFELQSIVISSSIKTIESSLFAHCISLESVVIEEGITSISNNAFGYCANLKEIVLPKSLTHIDSGCFYECSELKAIYFAGTALEWSNLTSNGFNHYNCNPTIYTYSKNQPLVIGNYWYYDDENKIVVW